MLAAITTLGMSGNALAHHPLFEMNPELYDRIETILEGTNSNHNEIVGDVEDYTFMGQMEATAAGEVPMNQSQVVDGATTSNMTVNQGSTGAQAAPGTGAGIGVRNRN